MAKGRYFRLGLGLIVAGAALIALNLWFLSANHWAHVPRGAYGGPTAIGLTAIIAGVMVLMGC